MSQSLQSWVSSQHQQQQQLAGQPASQPAGQSASQSVSQPVGQPAGQPAGQSTGQSVGQSTSQSASQSAGWLQSATAELLMFRPMMRWFDRHAEDLFTDALQQVSQLFHGGTGK